MRGVARRPRGADADRLHAAVHALEQQVQPTGAQAGVLQPAADRTGQPADGSGECLGGDQRLGEGQAAADQLRRVERDDRFEHVSQRLVQPAQQGGTEAAGQRRAGGGHKLADPRQAEAVQGRHGVVGEAERADRQGGESGCGGAGGDDGGVGRLLPLPLREGGGGRGWCRRLHRRFVPRNPSPIPLPQGEGASFCSFPSFPPFSLPALPTRPPVPHHRMRGARRVGDRRARGEPGPPQPRDQVGEQRRLPAGQVRGAGGVDPHPVRRIRRGQRCVAQAPDGEPAERRRVRLRLRLHHRQAGDARLGLRQRQAGTQAQGARSRIDRGDDAAMPVMRRGHEWRVNRRRVG